eukprot:CAMPEP_0115173090 /NCGR_PEP_ID=MMETSP0270-20121206/3149_1 /TAXON_ID=71861 /ORGANISM="Scrippsiella trochoidea, Strain CCMP3099" /LENGTH=44 /DNA_ID= /DNA_START= /DNA_END= /DNA_ORIENTATION=
MSRALSSPLSESESSITSLRMPSKMPENCNFMAQASSDKSTIPL